MAAHFWHLPSLPTSCQCWREGREWPVRRRVWLGKTLSAVPGVWSLTVRLVLSFHSLERRNTVASQTIQVSKKNSSPGATQSPEPLHGALGGLHLGTKALGGKE